MESSWVVMATIPDTVAQRMERMEPRRGLWFEVREGRGLEPGRGSVDGCFWSQ